MNIDVLISNLTNPVLLFFVLGIIASVVKSDLKIPESSSKFISLYLLFAIGFKGGQELSHSEFNAEILYSILIMMNDTTQKEKKSITSILKHSFTSGSVLMLVGSLVIGLIADRTQARGIEPFTTDIFKGFLSLFLLEMGMVTATRIKGFKKYGMFLFFFGILVPLFNGMIVAYVSGFITDSDGNRLLFSILAAGASYIAVPATMKLAEPRADAGIYIPMALGVTFPFNITIGMPIYYAIVQLF